LFQRNGGRKKKKKKKKKKKEKKKKQKEKKKKKKKVGRKELGLGRKCSFPVGLGRKKETQGLRGEIKRQQKGAVSLCRVDR